MEKKLRRLITDRNDSMREAEHLLRSVHDQIALVHQLTAERRALVLGVHERVAERHVLIERLSELIREARSLSQTGSLPPRGARAKNIAVPPG